MTELQIVDADWLQSPCKGDLHGGDYGRVAQLTEATAEYFIARLYIPGQAHGPSMSDARVTLPYRQREQARKS